ncbi:hypothetical protein F0562_002880 [Nyssa sinensis]|uniref:Uncharacterized protein n=1 Tax=Nyssa sinensis TaxID=561372 RepID=A0A5J5BYN8_9ASTE|nr:hypothetical protein F0562_002880 [Nyssa sinensis]
MEHHSDIEEGVPPDSSGLNRADPKILHNINVKIHHLPSLLPEACIFRVHHRLRRVNADAYTPMLVSIGPYHHDNPKLRAMEEHKLRYFHSLLKRNREKTAERYVLLMEKLEDRARKFYAEPICLTRDNFVEMMLLDACFLIEFLRKRWSAELQDEDDPIFKSPWMRIQISLDMILLENQLPFFVLSELFDMTQIPNSHTTLLDLSIFFITQTLIAPLSLISDIRGALGHKYVSESKHFLDLLHNVCRPSRRPTSSNESCTQMPCLTELHEAGVSFQVVESRLHSCFDIKFAQGHLKIPNFIVDDSTETLFRNIIAYEQHSSHVKPMCFTDYITFMDNLINREKDVTALRLTGIMENLLGDDEEVARIFNKMGDGIFIDSSAYYYSDLCGKLNKHCKTSWNRAMAKLRRNYFNNPWASISTIAAVFLISFTVNGYDFTDEKSIVPEDQSIVVVLECFNDIEEGVLPDSSGLNRADPKILHNINEKIRHLPSLLPEACIFRVHHGLRRVNADAYTPMLVSLGPYHHGNPKLRAMEEHKLRYLHSLLKRNGEESAERYLLLMEKLEDRARKFYAEPICLMRDNFVEMMLLDACFIIEFLREYLRNILSEELRNKDDPIFKSHWMPIQILRDMMLLENQLPFFVLSELFDMTQIPNSHTTLLQLSMIPMFQTLPAPLSLNSQLRVALGPKSVRESKHFLDLLHNVCRPSRRPTSSNKSCTRMPSLTELHEAGVSFQVVESSLLSFFDIKFAQGHLKIPNFIVSDSTERLFRNIIAYEQHSSDVKPMCFTDYTYFMDKLIDTEKDVTTLRLSGIMENLLGDDQEVACIFNKMGDGRIINSETYDYSDLCEKLNKHCETSWNQAMAKLRRNYFNNPWATISTIAAVFLIFLTLIQTVASLITLFA